MNQDAGAGSGQNQASNPGGGSSDEEMNEDIDLEASNGMDGVQPGSGGNGAAQASRSHKNQVSHAKINAQKESFWHEKPRLPCNK